MALGRAAGAEVRDDGRVRWVIGNSPIDYHNCVLYADLTEEEADGEIEASLRRMRAHGAPASWHVGPSMRPPDPGGLRGRAGAGRSGARNLGRDARLWLREGTGRGRVGRGDVP